MSEIDWLGFLVASIAVVLAPGPGSVLVARTAAASGRRAGAFAVFGIMLGDLCLIALAFAGVSAIFLAHPMLFQTIRLAGAGYLIWLGLHAIFTAQKTPANQGPHGKPFWQAVSITLLNPKAVVFFMAFFPLFIASNTAHPFTAYAKMTLVFMAVSAAYLLFLVHASAGLGLAFRKSRRAKSLARKLAGCVFVAFGVKVAVSK